ncbi:MAG: hypothetical protein ACPHRO_05865 [Nannocystaceae bacterium]
MELPLELLQAPLNCCCPSLLQANMEGWGSRLTATIQGEWAHIDMGVFSPTRVQRKGSSIVHHGMWSREIATTDGRNMTYNHGLGHKVSVDVTQNTMVMKSGLLRHRYSASDACQPEDRALGTAALEPVLQESDSQQGPNQWDLSHRHAPLIP